MATRLTRNAQICCAANFAALAKKLRSAPNRDPMIPGSAAAVFPVRRLQASDKRFNLSLNHSTSLFLSFGSALLPLPPVSETTIVEMIIPIAVSIAANVIPCSLNRVLIFSAREALLSKILAKVSLILKTWLQTSFLFIKSTASLSSRSVSALSILSQILSFSSSEYEGSSLISSSFSQS